MSAWVVIIGVVFLVVIGLLGRRKHNEPQAITHGTDDWFIPSQQQEEAESTDESNDWMVRHG